MGYRTDIAKWCDCWNYDYLQIKLVAFELEFDLSKFELVQWMSNHPPWGIQFHYFISSCEIKWPALLKGTSTIIEMNPLYWCILQKLTLQGQYNIHVFMIVVWNITLKSFYVKYILNFCRLVPYYFVIFPNHKPFIFLSSMQSSNDRIK